MGVTLYTRHDLLEQEKIDQAVRLEFGPVSYTNSSVTAQFNRILIGPTGNLTSYTLRVAIVETLRVEGERHIQNVHRCVESVRNLLCNVSVIVSAFRLIFNERCLVKIQKFTR